MTSEAHRKQKERLALARKIESFGLETIPRSFCVEQGRRCVMDEEKSSRCAECVRSKRSCDGKSDAWTRNVPRESGWETIAEQKERLKEQEDEALAKVLCLRKQRKLLLRREAEMVKRGLRFLDELDEAEEKERRERGAAKIPEQQAQPTAFTTSSIELSGDPLAGIEINLSDPFWANLGFSSDYCT